MPHIVLEYSSNLSDNGDWPAILEKLHGTVGDTESFETHRIKSRAIALDTYRVASGDGTGLVHATVIFAPGRSEALRRELAQRLLGILKSEVRSAQLDISRSVEVRQFEPDMYFTDRGPRTG